MIELSELFVTISVLQLVLNNATAHLVPSLHKRTTHLMHYGLQTTYFAPPAALLLAMGANCWTRTLASMICKVLVICKMQMKAQR